MSEMIKADGGALSGLIHGKGGGLTIPEPFERDIFLFDTFVAGTTHIEGIEDLEPHLRIDDRLDYFAKRITITIRWPLSSKMWTV